MFIILKSFECITLFGGGAGNLEMKNSSKFKGFRDFLHQIFELHE